VPHPMLPVEVSYFLIHSAETYTYQSGPSFAPLTSHGRHSLHFDHHSFASSTEITPFWFTVINDLASSPHRTATPGTATRRGSDHALELFRYCCTVMPVEPAVAKNWPE